jgi:hypothetical protein
MKYNAQQLKFYLQASKPETLVIHLLNAKQRMYQIWERIQLSMPLENNIIFKQKLNYIHLNTF